METERPFVERGLRLGALLDVLPVPVGLLVYTPDEFAEGVRRDRGIFARIADEGVDLF